MIDLLIGLGLALLCAWPAYILGRARERRNAPAPRAAFEVELKAHLRKEDLVLVTREVAHQAWGSVIESPHVPKGQVFAFNPETLRDIMLKMPPPSFEPRPVDNRHRPGCVRRHSLMGVCICPVFFNEDTPDVTG